MQVMMQKTLLRQPNHLISDAIPVLLGAYHKKYVTGRVTRFATNGDLWAAGFAFRALVSRGQQSTDNFNIGCYLHCCHLLHKKCSATFLSFVNFQQEICHRNQKATSVYFKDFNKKNNYRNGELSFLSLMVFLGNFVTMMLISM